MAQDEVLHLSRSLWMDGSGPAADIVLSSRVRLARNLAAHPFPHRADGPAAEKVLAAVAGAKTSLTTPERGYKLFRLSEMDPLDRILLAERHLISPKLADNDRWGGVLVSDDQAVAIMINEEDHLRIQVLFPGLSLENCWELASEIDDKLAEKLDFAYDEQRGYLTACPTNVGTGLRASVMLHLPALVMTRASSRVLGTLGKVGVAVRGVYGEGTEARGNLFQVSNQITLGQTEEEVLQNLTTVAKQIIDQERSARERLYREHKAHLEDQICRAYGILTHARMISSEEAMKLLSQVRLGIDLQVLSHVKPEVINELLIATRPAHLQKLEGKTLNPDLRDQRRAAILRGRLAGGA